MKYWKLSDYFFIVSKNRILLQRIFYSLALVSLLLDYWNHLLISQIGSNPILNQDVDPVYLLFMAAGIPQFLSGAAAPYFDALVAGSCLAALIWPQQRLPPLLFLLSYFVYFIVSNMLQGHHYTNIGVLMMALPFLFQSAKRFATVFGLCRFFFCFMMLSAACWKIARGNLWHIEQAHVLLISTHLDAIVSGEIISGENNPGFSLIQSLIENKNATHILWVMLILLEGFFIAGFLSFRFDKWLLASYLLFFAGGWMLFEIYNFENLLFLLTLAPVLQMINGSGTVNPKKTI